MYISFYVEGAQEKPYDELFKAAPYLDLYEHIQVITDGVGYLLFDNKDECTQYYDQTIGADGPTQSNQYDGPQRVYALTCGPDGQTLNENT